MTSEQDRQAHILRCAAEILKYQDGIDDLLRNELFSIADRVEEIAADLVRAE